jgi:hypothetical protein
MKDTTYEPMCIRKDNITTHITETDRENVNRTEEDGIL